MEFKELRMSCKFCEIGAGTFGNEIDRPVCENADYYAISSIGGFIPGWTLIFPKAHKLNMSVDYESPSFQDFVRKVTLVVSKEYGRCVHFEHGAATLNSQTGCGVNHGHLHIVPFSKSLESLALTNRPNANWRRVQSKYISTVGQGSEYLFCSDDFGNIEAAGLLSLLENSESQFFRKLISASLGLNSLYDYKQHRFEELSLSTATRLRRCFSAIDSATL